MCVCVCVWHTCMSHVCCSISLISETYTKVQEQSEALKLTHRARLILEVVVACDSAGICVCLSVRRRRRFGRPFARLVRSISRSRKVARESDSRAHARTVQSTPPPAVTLEGRRCIPPPRSCDPAPPPSLATRFMRRTTDERTNGNETALRLLFSGDDRAARDVVVVPAHAARAPPRGEL